MQLCYWVIYLAILLTGTLDEGLHSRRSFRLRHACSRLAGDASAWQPLTSAVSQTEKVSQISGCQTSQLQLQDRSKKGVFLLQTFPRARRRRLLPKANETRVTCAAVVACLKG